MADYPIPKNGVAYIFYTGLVSQADTKLLKSGPTLATGDFKVSIDGGALANLTTLPTNTPSGTMVKISLSAAEMTGDNITVVCIDAAGAEWCDQIVNIQTAARGVADLAYPATSGRSMVVDASGLVDANIVKIGPTGSGTAQTARDIGASVLLSTGTGTGQLDFTSGVVKANAVQLLGTAWLTPGVAGTPDVNTKLWNNLATVALPLIPTTAGRTLDVAATGEAGLDFNNILSSSLVTLNSLTITGATTFTGAITGSNASNSINLGTDSISSTQIAASAVTEIQSGLSTLTQTQVTGGAYSMASASQVLGDTRIANLDAAVSSRGTSTLTQSQVSGGAYALNSASFAFNSAMDFTTAQKAATLARVTLTDTATNLTNLPTMPTDWLTSTGLAASAVTEIWASVTDSSGVTTLLARLTSARAGYLDNINNSALQTTSAQTGDAYARLGAPVGASISTDVAGVPAALLGLTNGIETGVTLKQAIQRIAATTAGKCSGAGTGTEVYLGLDGATTRVTATIDGSGNRTAMVYA